jgi:transcriptional regulator with XRE-family HTH domain
MLSIKDIALRVRNCRRGAKLSQIELAQKSGVSLGTLKRFEATGQISLGTLLKLAFALGYEDDFDKLFTRKNYQSLDEVINEKH